MSTSSCFMVLYVHFFLFHGALRPFLLVSWCFMPTSSCFIVLNVHFFLFHGALCPLLLVSWCFMSTSSCFMVLYAHFFLFHCALCPLLLVSLCFTSNSSSFMVLCVHFFLFHGVCVHFFTFHWCFMSTETVRLIRDGRKWGKREIIYLSLHCHDKNDSCIRRGSDESHFNISVVRDKVTRQCPQTTTSEEKGEPKRIRTDVPLLTSLTPYR